MHTTQVASGNSCLKLLLAAASPLQSFFDHPATTHEFCNRQGIRILRSDGFEEYADFLHGYCKELNMGVNWADKGWKNIHHYFDPATKRGLWHFAGALSVFEEYYRLSLRLAGQRQLRRAVFFAGAAAHLVQDVCVPQHARAKLFDGHKQFEVWAQDNFAGYAVSGGGIYSETGPAASLLVANASAAADYFDLAKCEGDTAGYHQVAEVLLAMAQRTTAGLLACFAAHVFKAAESSPKTDLCVRAVA